MARRRAQSFERFSEMSLPTESEEVWRYSGIDRFDIDAFEPSRRVGLGDGRSEVSGDLATASEIAARFGPWAALVVTRDGVVSSVVQSDDLAEGSLEVTSALGGTADGEWQSHLGGLGWPRDAFGELNDAFLADVVHVRVAPKAAVVGPVVIVHLLRPDDSLVTEAGRGSAVFPRTYVSVGRSGEAGVIELFVEPGSPVTDRARQNLVVPVTELEVGEDAHLRYANLQLLGRRSTQIALQASRVDPHGSFTSFTAALGGCYARVRTDSDVAGEAARSTLLAAYLGTEDQVHDFRTLQDHHGRRTRSELLFKGAVADTAHSVYSGLIRIMRGAHGSDAFQTNHNLVLSEGAHADSVPNLDIDENDVRCSHASTVGPIDEEQLYYLESRGVEPSVAERLIVVGFFSDLARRAPFPGISEFLEASVSERLAGRVLAERSADLGPSDAGPAGPGTSDG